VVAGDVVTVVKERAILNVLNVLDSDHLQVVDPIIGHGELRLSSLELSTEDIQLCNVQGWGERAE
jgi:hypothetical protein